MTNLLATEFNNHDIERLVRVSYESVVLGVENWEKVAIIRFVLTTT